ncbi:RNA exonuclease 1 homolog isoform X2 [Gadus macrocephalus]|uniref:RNA exonuclease 1 homolog isoform X2 n=1 Tax=Gadus macrocephalus TaxID=80720 RepID=UPI0028CB992B|nr:RNA exonuclease 1 homolog isoform X2 [Gadus macrocephalus]
MLPASGFFAEVVCPFRRGLCERPHCLYKHEEQVREMFAASMKPVGLADFQGIPNYPPTESSESLQELARINKEIEDVKSEVEKEQRRLSRYQTETNCKHENGDGYKPSSHRRTPKLSSQAGKYVVDNSKPRTDLEYDPLSNFSADLRSYSSSGKDQKDKAGVKRAREVSCSDGHNLQSASREAYPMLENDLQQEGDLVIDIPSSPDLKKSKVHDVIENQSMVAEPDRSSPHNEVDHTPTHTSHSESSQGESSSVVLIESDKAVHRRRSQPIDMFDGLSKCLEDLRSENQRMAGSHADSAGEERRSSLDGCHFEDARPTVEFSEISITTMPPQAYADKMAYPAQSNRDPHPAPSVFYHLTTLTVEPPTNTAQHYWSPTNSVPTVVPCGQAHTATPPSPSGSSDGDHSCPWYRTSESNVQSHLLSPQTPPPTEYPPGSPSGEGKVTLIESSSGESATENLHYSDMEMSDSDPMEECYRIFMEANEAEKGAQPPAPPVPLTGNGDEQTELETSVVEEKPQALSSQKRVAHIPRRPEPVAVVRPRPKIPVPLRGGASGPQLPHHPKVLQLQQRATPLTASVNAQSTHQRRPESGAPVHPSQIQLPVSVQSAYMSCIPVGNALIQVGNNLHFILPEGSYPLPLSSMASSVSTVLTPISAVSNNGLQSFQLSAVTPVHRYRPDPSAPLHMVGNMSLLPSVSALGHTGLGTPSGPQGALQVPPKPLTKRKVKQRSERVKDKVPHDVRQRYVNMFTEEFLKTSPTVKDSFEKALAEERTVYNRSANKLKYLSVAVNALKRMKNQSAVPTKDENEMSGKRAKGNIPLNMSLLVGRGDAVLYESLKEYIMNEEKLIEHNYPLQNPERPGSAILFADNKKTVNDPLKRICCRCGATYSVSKTGKHTRKEECNYHYGKGVEKKVPGGDETRYSCCEGVMGAPGCQVFRLHVHDAVDMNGFVSSRPREDPERSCPGVYSLDCEMCYTTHGLELSRITVVNSALHVVYDTFVKPGNDVVDFNTRFSGISEKDLKEDCPSVGEVQQTLLRFVSVDTILVGHGLETSLCALKFLHGTVVDTSVLFPHRMGPPHKLTLNNLTADYLRRIIQDSVCGHDTADDAAACMELVLWKMKEDGKGRKW